jgi:phenylacetate-CoA ligase
VNSGEPSQLEKLNQLLAALWESNQFYRAKWLAAGVKPGRLRSLDDLQNYPLTTRVELARDQQAHPPFGTNHTFPVSSFTRLHRSSGTTGTPVFWGDDAASWRALISSSRTLWERAGVGREDRVFLAMPFGASLGPWSMAAGGWELGCLCFAPGQATNEQELAWIKQVQPTVLASKPAHLLALAAAAESAGVDAASLGVRKLIAGGAPGGHEPETRRELERWWGAECFDRYGMTEAGPIAGECSAHSGAMHLLEKELIAELIVPGTEHPAAEGNPGELVLTNLNRIVCPIMRYRTGDVTRLERGGVCQCGNPNALIKGGVKRMRP